jgi:hypothetical protein
MAPVRYYVLAQVLLTGVAMFLFSYHIRGGGHHAPVQVWLIHSVALLCIQFWISVSERDQIGPRLARSVPQRVWLRPAAFLFTTGAAGGVALFALLLAGVLGAARWWLKRHESMPGQDALWDVLRCLTSVALFVYCYGLTAVLLRRYALSNHLKSGFTWLVALLLAGLGSAVPSLIAFGVLRDELRYWTEPGWWNLTNPFLSSYEAYEASRSSYDYPRWLFVYLWSWAGLASLSCLPWFIGQVRQFRPAARWAVLVQEPPPVAPPAEAPVGSNGAGEVPHGVRG